MTPQPLGDERARQIIRTSLDESLIVEASAGTGKTTELVARIVAVLRTGRARIDQIVAVTFTNKAAGELKVRLRQELDTARAGAASSELSNLEQAIEHLEESAIGTIHAFCGQVLRERPVEARVDPAFQDMQEAEQERMFDQAFQQWFERALNEERPGLRRALSRMAWSGGFEGAPTEQLRFAGKALVEWRDFPARWRREPFDRNADLHELGLLILAMAGRARAAANPKDDLAGALRPFCDMERWIHRAKVRPKQDYDLIEALMIKLLADVKRFKRFGRAAQYSKTVSREQVKAEREAVITKLEEFKQRADADFAAELQGDMLDLIATYEELKRRAGKLDFVDLLSKVRDLVRDNAEVRTYLQDRFTHFFVDEFQDTDPVQAEILLLLSAQDPHESDWNRVIPKPGKLFIVGDPKQSIYRFRRADVILYQHICERLTSEGARLVHMSVSHRAPAAIQQCVNAAFGTDLVEDHDKGQPGYVPLEGQRTPIDGQPSVVVLPPPRPWSDRGVTKTAIDACFPDAVAAFIEWLVKESGWKVRAPGTDDLVPIQPRHITVLFRRFINWRQDVTRPYARSLESRGVPHLLVGSKSYHQREEVEGLRAACAAIEWPADELSVYAALKGACFAIPDNLLLRYRIEVGHLHPLRPAEEQAEVFAPIHHVLATLADLHRRRNERPVAETLNLLLEAARAHAGFALRPGGHQVVANVYRLADLARNYEMSGGISFRGFVEELGRRAERQDGGESPLVEESADGVRLMTVHNAKGLEFPVVILADMTANIAQQSPDRRLDPARRLCAMRLLRCAPHELAECEALESDRDKAEGMRVAYVAATRARDLLVVPAVGDYELTTSWIAPLNKAVYPPKEQWRQPSAAAGCPRFGDRTVLSDDPRRESEPCVAPGLYEFGAYDVVWWDPGALRLDVDSHQGISNSAILSGTSEASHVAYDQWRAGREKVIAQGSVPSLEIANPTDMPDAPAGISVELFSVTAAKERPYGPRFGTLVHAVLNAAVGGAAVEYAAPSLARSLGCDEAETSAAEEAARAALQHWLLQRARASARCYRELPVSLRIGDGNIMEGTIDLAFEDDGAFCVVDYKTDAPSGAVLAKYQRQVGWYGEALRRIAGKPVRCYLLSV